MIFFLFDTFLHFVFLVSLSSGYSSLADPFLCFFGFLKDKWEFIPRDLE